jgi:Domain of unknown function (DUF4430)
MKSSRTIALGGACIALAVTPAVALASGPTTVSVRVEGKTRTLLAATTVSVPAGGSITKGGTPAGTCPAPSAAGALDAATHHRWGGTYSSGLGIELTSILGETHSFTSSYYWSISVNDKYAQVGMCDLKLHKGDQLLFAAVPDKGTEYPIVISAPRHATVGHAIELKVAYANAKGIDKPLVGASIDGHVTNKQGVARVTAAKAGKLHLTAARAGYVRAEATVTVS